MRIRDLRTYDKGRWVEYTAPHGEKQRGRIKDWNDQFVFVVYHCDNNWEDFQKYTAAATKPDHLRFYIDLDFLKSLPKRTVFAAGTLMDIPTELFMSGSGKELLWVAERGEIHDWTIYCHFAEGHDIEWVRAHGDKVCRKSHIEQCVAFSDKAFAMYRY